jgi:uncharacterized protein (TIGR04255 family)
MATQRHLKNAPIREGLIDIQFEQVPMERLKSFSDSVKSEFTEAATLWQGALGFEVRAGQLPLTLDKRSAAVGFRLSRAEHVLMIRTNGFTVSRLAPYQDWDELKKWATHYWSMFVEATNPEMVNRMAVRYINVLPIPLGKADFREFLVTAPDIPQELPQSLGSFLQRVVMIDPEGNRHAAVTQVLEDSELTEGRVEFILDIDAVRDCRLSPNDAKLWEGLDSLRDFKNKIFFEFITEKTARLFE